MRFVFITKAVVASANESNSVAAAAPSLRPFDCAQGRVVGPSARCFFGTAEAVPFRIWALIFVFVIAEDQRVERAEPVPFRVVAT